MINRTKINSPKGGSGSHSRYIRFLLHISMMYLYYERDQHNLMIILIKNLSNYVATRFSIKNIKNSQMITLLLR